MRSVHVALDTRCDQPTERTRDQRPRIQHCRPKAKLLPRIPRTEIEQTPGKICCFDETQEEATRDEPAKVLARSCGPRNDAPYDHAGGKVDCRLTSLVEKEVGGDLHENVPDKQDRDGRLIRLV